ncbi:MAG: hypothetical protein ABWX94_00715 [Candidatus Saccharimonadales bacterium]
MSERNPKIEEVFTALVCRFEGTPAAIPHLISDALADAKRGEGVRGASFEFAAGIRGEAGQVDITPETVTFRVGDQGPFSLAMREAVELLLPPDPSVSPTPEQ